MIRKLILGVIGLIIVVAVTTTVAGYLFFSGDGVRRAIEQQSSAWLGQRVQVDRASVSFFPSASITLRNVRVGDPVRLTLDDVRFATDFRALLSRRIEKGSVVIANSLIQMPLPFAIPEDSTPKQTGSQTTNQVIQIVSIDSISLRKIRMTSRGREIVVSADSALDGERLRLQQFSAESGKTSLGAEGEISLGTRRGARLRVKANRLDVDELLALADAFTPEHRATAQRRSSSTPFSIAARIIAETATAGGVEVKQFATDMDVNGDQITLSPLTFQIFGGRYQGSANATLGKLQALTLRSRLQDLDVAQLAAFGGSPNSVSGTLTGAGTFSGQGADMNAVLRSVRGKGTVSIVNGSIQRLDLVRTVVLFFGRPAPDTAAGSDKFDRIDIDFFAADQIFRADAFALHSRDVDIVGSGTLTTPTDALDGALDLSLSEELSKQAGTDLVRYTREGTRVVLPARITGTVSKPRLTIDAAAAAKRGLRNEVERRLKGVLDKFQFR